MLYILKCYGKALKRHVWALCYGDCRLTAAIFEAICRSTKWQQHVLIMRIRSIFALLLGLIRIHYSAYCSGRIEYK